MAGLVQGLKKGNATLSKQINELKQLNEELRIENRDLKIENCHLKNKVLDFQSQKNSREDELINFFSSMYSKVLNSID